MSNQTRVLVPYIILDILMRLYLRDLLYTGWIMWPWDGVVVVVEAMMACIRNSCISCSIDRSRLLFVE